ncbi:MAG: response regulator [Verrucomicrobia bacterium]|nr:response regulator [Verrucomicrobiota bacterium]
MSFHDSVPRDEFRVIVADDDDLLREVVCAPLRQWGFTVVEASNGRQALDAALAHSGPVLVILDWIMPGLDGLEVCRRVRASDKLAYILLLTSRAETRSMAEGLKAGADDYLVKRMNREELCIRLSLGLRMLSLQSQLLVQAGENVSA